MAKNEPVKAATPAAPASAGPAKTRDIYIRFGSKSEQIAVACKARKDGTFTTFVEHSKPRADGSKERSRGEVNSHATLEAGKAQVEKLLASVKAAGWLPRRGGSRVATSAFTLSNLPRPSAN